MKTSNKLVCLGILLILGFLLVHDYSLRASYLTKDYLQPLTGFTPLGYKGFNEVSINSAKCNAKIVQGPFKVMAAKDILENIIVKQQGNELIIDAKNKSDLRYLYSRKGYCVYISCPSLKSLKMDDTILQNTYYEETKLSGFSQDSLNIVLKNGSNLKLDSNSIGQLDAEIKDKHKYWKTSNLEITRSNQIKSASIHIRDKSVLDLDCMIPNLDYQMDDSASINLSGAVSNYMRRK